MKKSSITVSQKKAKNKKNFRKKFRKQVKKNLMDYLGWSCSISLFIARITCSILQANGIWLKRIAQVSDKNDGNIKTESEIRKLQRFFLETNINYQDFSLMLYLMLNIKEKVTVIIDRTNWDFGKIHINVFVASILFKTPDGKSFAIPIVWEVFDKKGASNTEERIDLIKKLVDVIGKNNIDCVLGDREFIGEKWIKFLHDNKILFILRIRNNMYVEVNKKRVKIDTLVSSVTNGKKQNIDAMINKIPVQLVATRSKENNLVVVIASTDIKDDPLNEYRLRWFIELFFKSIKSQGFKLEETHMTNPAKIKKLFALIALATLYAAKSGAIKHCCIKPISIKKHGRPTYSLFTYGLDFLRALFSGEIPSIDLPIFNRISSPWTKLPQQKELTFALSMG